MYLAAGMTFGQTVVWTVASVMVDIVTPREVVEVSIRTCAAEKRL